MYVYYVFTRLTCLILFILVIYYTHINIWERNDIYTHTILKVHNKSKILLNLLNNNKRYPNKTRFTTFINHNNSKTNNLQHNINKSIAICIAGNTRSFVLNSSRLQIYERIIKPIEANADIFVILAAKDNRNYPLPTSMINVLKIQVQESLKPTYLEFIDDEKAMILKSVKCRKNMAAIPQAIFYNHCYKAINNEEIKRGGYRYRWAVRARPDTIYGSRIPELKQFPQDLNQDDKIVWSNYLGGCYTKVPDPGGHTCLNDEFLIAHGPAIHLLFKGMLDDLTTCTLSRTAHSCPECVLGASLTARQVEKRVIHTSITIHRKYHQLTKLNENPIAHGCILESIKNVTLCEQQCKGLTGEILIQCKMMLAPSFDTRIMSFKDQPRILNRRL